MTERRKRTGNSPRFARAMSAMLELSAIDPAMIAPRDGSTYPDQFKPSVAGRSKQR
jgi:hypothetical protein